MKEVGHFFQMPHPKLWGMLLAGSLCNAIISRKWKNPRNMGPQSRVQGPRQLLIHAKIKAAPKPFSGWHSCMLPARARKQTRAGPEGEALWSECVGVNDSPGHQVTPEAGGHCSAGLEKEAWALLQCRTHFYCAKKIPPIEPSTT